MAPVNKGLPHYLLWYHDLKNYPGSDFKFLLHAIVID
jgi:hypothetical protein